MSHNQEDDAYLSPGPPPVTYSDCVYDYPADPPPKPPWLAIIGAVVAVIALVVAALALIGPTTSGPTTTTVTTEWPVPPVVTSVSTVTLPPPPPAPPRTVTSTVPVPVPPAPRSQPQSACQTLRAQADIDNSVTGQATGYWVPQLSSKRPGLVADGITWDCDSIWAEHAQLRAAYNANLVWSGDWPNTYHNGGYWVTYAAYVFDTADEARQWCVDHGRDVPEHCYPTQIR